MELRMKLAVFSGIAAIVLAITALTIAPVGATYNHSSPNRDSFRARSSIDTRAQNSNSASVSNSASQTATTGSVTVHNNDDPDGQHSTGMAANEASGATTVEQSNSSVAEAPALPSLPSVDLNSYDDVNLQSSIRTRVENTNTASVTNQASQTATTGSISVYNNDDVSGNTTTGDAYNWLTFTTSVSQGN